MSAIADVTLLPVSAVDGLQTAATSPLIRRWFRKPVDPFREFIVAKGTPGTSYEWPGYYIATLLVYFDEHHQLDLMKGEYDELATLLCAHRHASFFILTNAHRAQFADRLQPTDFSAEALRKFYEEFNEETDEEAGQAMLDGITFLRDNLRRLNEQTIGLLSIG